MTAPDLRSTEKYKQGEYTHTHIRKHTPKHIIFKLLKSKIKRKPWRQLEEKETLPTKLQR